jgi:hypothetical protein
MGIIHAINTRDLAPKEAFIRIDGSFAASAIGDLAATQAKRLDLIKLVNAPVLAVELQIRNVQITTAAGTFGINGVVEASRPLTGANLREAFTRRYLYTSTAALGTGIDVRLTPSQLDHLVSGTVNPRAGEGIGGITTLQPIINGTATVANAIAAGIPIPTLDSPFTRSYPEISFGLELHGTALTGNIILDATLKVWYLASKESDRPLPEFRGYGNAVTYGRDVISAPTTGDFDIATSLSTIAASVTAAS